MASSRSEHELVLLDACCILNLFATGRAAEILAILPYQFALAEYVADEEVLEIDSDAADSPSGLRPKPLRLAPLLDEMVRASLLEKLRIVSEDERKLLLHFATHLDDGEAHTMALALSRRARVATDDKKAIRVFSSAFEQVHAQSRRASDPCLRTSQLIFQWAELAEIREEELAQVLDSVTTRASFHPPKRDPNFERWKKLVPRIG